MAVTARPRAGVCVARFGHVRSGLALLMLTVALACCGQASRAGVVLFDNLSAGSPNGSTGVTNTVWLSQAFTTTATDFVLDSVSLRLWNQNGTSGNFELQVWDALGASGSPGSLVGSAIYTGLAQNLGSSYGSLLNVSSLNVLLAASTNYHLLARGTSLTDIPGDFGPDPGTLYWDQTNVNPSASYLTVNSGTNWSPEGTNKFMSVTAVPEPSSGVLFAMGLAAWAMLRRRR